MKILYLLSALIYVFIYSGDFETRGDHYYSLRHTDSTSIDSAIFYYSQAAEYNDDLLFKLADAMDYKLLKSDNGCKIKPFIDSLELIYRDNMKLSAAYTLMVMWGRYGESCGIAQAVRYRIPDKIRNYALWLMDRDIAYHDFAALLALGRLHYMTPNIPLFLTWPSMDKSLFYLEMFMDSAADTTPAIEYIKDTKRELHLL